MTLTPRDLDFEQIKVGDVFSFKKLIDGKLIDRFAELVGDYSTLHMDAVYAKENGFENRLAHGLLIGSLFSTLVGMFCPGRRALYLSQSLNFKKPVVMGKEILIKGKVLNKSESTKIIRLETLACDDKGVIVVEGEALVKVRSQIKT